MQPSRPFLLRTPGLLILTTFILALVIDNKYPSTVREKPCCGYTGAMRVNGHMMCAKPNLSICWDDEVNLLSEEVELGREMKGQNNEVMKMFSEMPTEAELVVHIVVSGVVIWGLLSWFGVSMKEVLGACL